MKEMLIIILIITQYHWKTKQEKNWEILNK